MTDPQTWRVLGNADAHELVLAVDFDATGRAEGRFTDLASGLGDLLPCSIWETIPQEAGTGAGDADPVERWLEEVTADGRPVRAVFGFCVGGVYAGAIAQRLAARQEQAPALVLFDPEQSGPLTLYSQFYKVLDSMSALLSAEETAQAADEARRAHEQHTTMAALGAELLDVYRRTAKPAFDRLELDTKRTEEITAVFASFVGYLIAAADIDPLPAWREAVAVTSSSPTSGLNGSRAAGQDIAVGRELRVDVPHVDLLRDPGVTRTVTELLGADRPA
ncbi:hypothetical protein HCJ93_28055 [Streptomyces sp. SBST2-5]|uniref:Polyketide synthase thioesterase domain-containing protein n=1 Tax=Streptomyces composti TaxID=2720025 RepID=A0ABX1AHC1_9ACTN|nr:hypothetical protein [Streptomyces composti]NJP53816.1 hypothetical protein [Streptomyces composti]